MTDEIFTNVDRLFFDIDDYHTAFEYDLTGNRLSKTITDTDNDSIFNALSATQSVPKTHKHKFGAVSISV